MDDKFIMMGLGEAGSKEMAEVLGNKTCKAIVDYLGDCKEASEKDISKSLEVPLNTVEYNLKKLIKVGLVEKSKNFFWSVKGKKIPMYKLAKKHIIIGTKKPSLNILKSLLPVLVVVLALALIVLSLNVMNEKERGDLLLKQFNSFQEMKDYLKQGSESYSAYFGPSENLKIDPGVSTPEAGDTSGLQRAEDYSTTNIQVKGIDEADIVKNDGKYIYYLDWNKVYIVEAYPADELKILSEINITGGQEMFINENKLIIFSNDYSDYGQVLVNIYDVSDKIVPILIENYSLSGTYLESRMIGDEVYVLSQEYVDINLPELPRYSINGIEENVRLKKVYYWNNLNMNFVFTNVMKFDLGKGEEGVEVKSFLGGYNTGVYVSENNIYFTYYEQVEMEDYFEEAVKEVFYKVLPKNIENKIEEVFDDNRLDEWEKQIEIGKIIQDYVHDELSSDELRELEESATKFYVEKIKEGEKTVITRVDLEDLEIGSVGEVPGRVLNQFSMHEQDKMFFIATTSGDNWQTRGESSNNLYSLNMNLEIVDRTEDLAKGERIYSVRFMQNRVYLVTFRQTDPLYVIDISNPDHLEVLGYLKVTGFSNYLHPYDETHLLGIGSEADENGRVQGLKVSLFDVSDVENPREVAKYVVEGWSNSNAQWNHKSVLFDKTKGILSIPLSITNYDSKTGDYGYWQGAYVFNVTDSEISLRGEIEHEIEYGDEEPEYYYWRQSQDAIQRTLFMDNVIYSLSQRMIKASDLDNLKEINNLDLGYEPYLYYYGYMGRTGIDVLE